LAANRAARPPVVVCVAPVRVLPTSWRWPFAAACWLPNQRLQLTAAVRGVRGGRLPAGGSG